MRWISDIYTRKPCFHSVLFYYSVSMKQAFQKSENLLREWFTERQESVLMWSAHPAEWHVAWHVSPTEVTLFPLAAAHRLPLALLRWQCPWPQCRGRKETKARTETKTGGDTLDSKASRQGQQKDPVTICHSINWSYLPRTETTPQ